MGTHIAIRDSKHPNRGHLTLNTPAFTAFLDGLKAKAKAKAPE